MVLAANGKVYFAARNNSTGDDVFIFSSDGSTINRVAGNTGAASYVLAENGTSALTAHLTRVQHMQEHPTTGDLLVWDGNYLRLITIATDSSSPKIYDLFSFTIAGAGYTVGTNPYDFYYDATTESSNVVGTGTIYYSTSTALHKFVPNAAKTSAVDTTYTISGTPMDAGIRFTLHPTDGLLIMQANKNRILRIAP